MKLSRLASFFIISLVVVFSTIYLSRLWLASFLAKSFFQRHHISLQMELTSLSWNRLTIKNLVLDQQNKIPLIDMTYSPLAKKINSIHLEVQQLHINSLMSIKDKILSVSSSPPPSSPMSFSESLSMCQKILEPSWNINLQKVILDQEVIEPHLSLAKQDKGVLLKWSAPQSQGELSLHCSDELIRVESPKLVVAVNQFRWNSFFVDKFDFKISEATLQWRTQSPIQWILPARLGLSFKTASDQELSTIDAPEIVIRGQSEQADLKKIIVSSFFRKTKIQMGSTYAFESMDMTNEFDLSKTKLESKGQWHIQSFSWKTKIPILSGLHIKSKYDWDGDQYHVLSEIKDKTNALHFSNLKIQGLPQNDQISLELDPLRSSIRTHSQITQCFPFLKEFIKSLNGPIEFAGSFLYAQQKFDGQLVVQIKNLKGETEFGNFEGLTLSHKIKSFDTYESPPHQKLEVKKILIGPGIENLKVDYQIENLNKIHVDELSLSFEDAQMTAKNFILNVLQKRVERFSAVFIGLSLEKLLSLALKDTITAKGQMMGHLNVNYVGSRPVIDGLLAAANPGWIHYRTGQPQKQLSIRDGPMDILNNYLYNFQYETLSLKLSSDVNYDMDMVLGTFGHNPDYLNGKELKLNVNIEQNLLAALRSVMLTYDLPDRIQERLEKVDP